MGPSSSNSPDTKFDRGHFIRFKLGGSLQNMFHYIEGLALNRTIDGVAIDWDNTCQPLVRRKLWDTKKRHRKKKLSIPQETVAFIKACQQAGLKVAVATNSMGNFDAILHLFHLHGVDDLIVIQPGPGRQPRKPQQAFFDLVAERMGLTPSRIVMVGDKYQHDCIPALQAGMYAVYVPPLGKDLLAEVVFGRRRRDKRKLKEHGHV